MPVLDRHGSVLVVTPQGALRTDDVPDMDAKVQANINGGVPMIVINLSETPLIDGQGLEWILNLDEACCRRGGCVRLCGVGELCRDVLRITGVGESIKVYDDLTAALGSFA
tara:strand:+ start:53056 stop:53388 length:333 start_codon:yes stop_codon:yes gene_type:complete